MKKKITCLVIILLGLFILPNSVMAEEIGAGGCDAVQITGMQHLNSVNDVGRQWNIYVGSTRVFCMDAGKKARTNMVCTYLRQATSEEVKQLTNVQNNEELAHSMDPQTYTNVITSAGQGTLANGAGVQLNMVASGYDKYSINRAAAAYANAGSGSGKSGGYVVYACNGDAEGNTWQRMLVPSGILTCDVKEEKKTCPKGQMVKEDLNISCDKSCVKGDDEGSCNPKEETDKTSNGTGDGVGVTTHVTYSAASGDKSYIHPDHGYDLGASVGKFCRVYCTEEGWATMPGGIDEPLPLGSYIVWPTSQSNFTADKFRTYYYPLRFKGQLNCELDVMSDIEPDHANMPAGCHDAVEATYQTNYTYVSTNWYNKDYNKDNLEFVRYTYIKRTKNPSSLCKANYDVGGQSCLKTAEFAMGSDGAKYTYCYSKIVDRLGKEESRLAKLKAELAAINPTTCPIEVNEYANGVKVGSHTEDSCKEAYDAKKREVEQQERIVSGFVTAKIAIEGAINACTAYTNAYEVCAGIQHEMHICGKWQISENDYHFSSNAQLEYSDKSKKKDDNLISYTLTTGIVKVKQDGPNVTNPGITVIADFPDNANKPWTDLLPTSTLIGKITELVHKKFGVDQTDYYGLQTKYQYLDKNKLQYKTTKPKDVDSEGSDKANFIKINTKKVQNSKIVDNDSSGVIPTSYDNIVGEKYTLKIRDIYFGQAQFGMKDDSDNGTDYACKVTFFDAGDKCVCPEGTKNAGKSLVCTELKCLDAQKKYCDDDDYVEKADCELYCSTDMSKSLARCMNTGKTYEECNTPEYCDDYHCPNTEGVENTEEMDKQLRECVVQQMAVGIPQQDAITWCEPQACNLGLRIIYRTIKLENPFPSYNADDTTVQKDLRAAGDATNAEKGMFNNDIKGRHPGSNWDSEEVVRDQIRYNRNVSGSSVYDIAPLYTFILNTRTIQDIRSYNDTIEAGYNDFNLRCKKDRSVACVSDFVHNKGLSGLVGGVCADATSDTDFYTCVYKHSEY